MKKYQELREKYPRFLYLLSTVEVKNNQLKLAWHFRIKGQVNNLDFHPSLTIPLPTSTSSTPTTKPTPNNLELPSYLIPLGGGKDSIVTLELIKQIYNLKSRIYNPVYAFAINPTNAIKQTAQIADVPLISVKRQLDPTMLKLNNQGFLNGHTPFSALVAFVSTLVAKFYQLNNIALSNESSANEPTLFWQGHPINHQYSKSLQFESNFRDYLASSPVDVKNLAFYIGLVEMLSYWKLTASPEIIIQAGDLNQNQLKFWQDLLLNGLSEYFYVNQIPFWEEGFVKWRVEESIKDVKIKKPATQMRNTSGSGGQNSSNYFSFLRPLHELQIAKLFAQIGKPYFQVFRSCNVGQKQGIWCNACPKCLFAFCMIFPFVGEVQALEIWGENLLQKKSLLQTAYQLIGAKIDDKQNVKPFECVGTKLESLVAFWLATKWYKKHKQSLPYILKQFEKNIFPQYQDLDQKAKEILSSFDKNNHLPKSLETFLEKNIQNPKFKIQNLKFLIFGLGREGLSTFNFLSRQGVSPKNTILVDDKPANKLSSQWQEVIKQYSLKVITPAEIMSSESKVGSLKLKKTNSQPPTSSSQLLIIKSPGIPHSHPLIKWAHQHHLPITSNTQMFFETVRKLNNKPDIQDRKKARIKQANFKDPLLRRSDDLEQSHQRSVVTDEIQRSLKFSLLDGKPLIIGVTGTKGKSTTSALIAHILKKAGFNVKLGGNLGTPPLELVSQLKVKSQKSKLNQKTQDHEPDTWMRSTNGSVGVAASGKPDREFAKQTSSRRSINSQPPTPSSQLIYVLELSSHQLADLDQSPDIAVWLNLYPEHLDYYESINEYAQAKSHIFKHQRHQDHFIYNADDPIVTKFAQKAHSRLVPLTFKEAEKIDLTQTKLIGRHNRFNLLAATKVVQLFDIDPKTALKLANDFTPLPHRLEKVVEINGVNYINDSLATNPTATIKAIEAFEDKPIILITGGYDRGLDYTSLAQAITNHPNIKAVIALPDTGKKVVELIRQCHSEPNSESLHRQSEILNQVQDDSQIQLPTPNFKLQTFSVSNLFQAVALAKKLARPGDTVLMSPASASFNQFRNYKERGQKFSQLVLAKS